MVIYQLQSSLYFKILWEILKSKYLVYKLFYYFKVMFDKFISFIWFLSTDDMSIMR